MGQPVFSRSLDHSLNEIHRSFLAGTEGEPAAAHAVPQLHERQLRQAEGLDRQDHQGRIYARQRIRGRTVLEMIVPHEYDSSGNECVSRGGGVRKVRLWNPESGLSACESVLATQILVWRDQRQL